MSRSTRTPASWNLRNVSTLISLSMPRRLIQAHNFRFLWIFCFRNHNYIYIYIYTSIPLRRKVSPRISLRELILLVFSRNGSFQFYRRDTSLIHNPLVNQPVLCWKMCLSHGYSTMNAETGDRTRDARIEKSDAYHSITRQWRIHPRYRIFKYNSTHLALSQAQFLSL